MITLGRGGAKGRGRFPMQISYTTTMDDYVNRLGGKDDWVRKFPRR